MGKTGLWFFLSLKRQAGRLHAVLLLLLLPACLWGFREAGREGEEKISIALYAGESEWNRQAAEKLLADGGSFSFYLSGSEEALREDVAARRAECGYIFPENLRERLESGDYKRSIVLVTAPSTVADKLSSEVVFSGLFSVWGRELLKSFSASWEPLRGAASGRAGAGKGEENARKAMGMEGTQSRGALDSTKGAEIWEELEPLYDKYLENGSTFAFRYETSGGGTFGGPSVKTSLPARGIVSVFVFVMALTAGVTACEDERRGLFSLLSGARREAAVAACLAAPVLLSCASGFLGLLAAGEIGRAGWGREAALLLAYGAACTLFSWALCRLLRNSLLMACLIPFFIIGSLILCPVFVDLSSFIPAAGTAGRLFLPYYYLKGAAFLLG